MKREIKFRVFFNDKLVGYERLSESGWEWMAIDLNPDTGERWTPGVFVPGVAYKRDAFTGLTDKTGKDVYEHDIIHMHVYTYIVRYEFAKFVCYHHCPGKNYHDTKWGDLNRLADPDFYGYHWEVIGNIHHELL
jgi:hypothetical protein